MSAALLASVEADSVRVQLARARTEAEELASDLAPMAAGMDIAEAFDPGLLALLKHHRTWTAFHGNAGAPPLLSVQSAWIEAIASQCTSTSVLVQSQGTVAHTLVLSRCDAGESMVDKMRAGALCGWGLTEPEAGSDILAMRTTARPTEDGYVISGEKRFITNVDMADYYLVFARTKPERKRDALSAFVVPADTAGLTVSRREKKMGLRASPTGDLSLDDVRIGHEALVGEEGQGFSLVLETLRWSRPLIAAVSVGVARGSYQAACDRLASDREARQKLSVSQQGAGHELAQMAIEIASARALLYEIAADADTSGELPEIWSASATKALASDVAMRTASRAVDLCGLGAVTAESPLQRYLRDAKVLQIFEGTNEIQRNAIVKNLPSFS